jgi:two-component system response regulator YesN
MATTLFKVMIVDDEILAVEDLTRLIPWEEKGFQIVATATNSAKSLELYQKYYPQIIFMDIRMPVMDGLELSRRILSFGHPVKIILLTAYRDFDYAKQAVEIGVSNYLLKHDINESSIFKELDKIRRELEEESEKNRILRRQFLKNIIETRKVEAAVGQKATAIYERPDLDYTLMLVVPDQPYLEQLRTSNPPAIDEHTFDPLEFPEFVSHYDSLNVDGNSVLIFIVKRTNSQSEARERTLLLAGQVQLHLEKRDPATFSMIITRTCGDKCELAVLYKKVISVLPYLVFYDRDKIIHSDDLPANAFNNPQNHLDNTLMQLVNSLHELDIKLVSQQIRDAFEQMSNPGWNPDALKRAAEQLLYLLEHFQKENHLRSVFEKYASGSGNLFSVYNICELRDWFVHEFNQAIQQVHILKQQAFSRKTQQTIQFIHEHYAEDLTVDKVAENLGFSGVYLSQLFKKETQQTFLEYLTDYRIGIAKNLLMNSDYKIYEIAEIVGYKTSQYFSQVFRKITGVYPIDYRGGGTKP